MQKRNNTIRDIIVVGFALFSMFFGAGNVIFPPYLGMEAGPQWLAGFSAYFIADIGLALLGMFALLRVGSSEAVTLRVGKVPSEILMCAIILCIGPMVAIPRTSATTFEMAIAPNLSGVSPVLFSVLFFAVILICHKKELIKGYFISGFTVALVFSPWLAVTIRQFVLRMRYDDGSTAELATLYSVMDYCKEWFSAVETPIGIVVLLGMALCLVLSYGAVDWVRQNHNIAPAIAFGTFALTGIVGGVISATVNNCFMGRYAFPGMGFVMLWYAVGFAQITENTKGKSRKIWAAGLLGTAGLCFLLQYTSEIRLEYDDGLETYENFVEEYMTENDAIIGPYTHTIFLNVYHPELHYYTIAYKLYSLPFVNTEALSSYSQLDTYDNLWYICFQGGYPNEMEDEYSYEQVLEFHYMYYDFAIFRLEKLEEE